MQSMDGHICMCKFFNAKAQVNFKVPNSSQMYPTYFWYGISECNFTGPNIKIRARVNIILYYNFSILYFILVNVSCQFYFPVNLDVFKIYVNLNGFRFNIKRTTWFLFNVFK